MVERWLQKLSFSLRKQRPATPKRKRLARSRLNIECLETRDLPAPLAWSAGVPLPTASGGLVAVQNSVQSTVILGGSSGAIAVPTFAAANPAWETAYTYSTPLDQPRFGLGAGVLPDGSLLIFGGQDGEGDSLYSAYNFTGTTSTVASMNASRSLFGYATDENHLIYAIGGQGGGGRSAEVYNQASNTWTLIASLPQSLSSLSAVADGAGHIFAIGGIGGNGQISAAVYRYTIATNLWDTVAPLPVATEGTAAVLGSNGLIYVLGGVTSSGTTGNVESYNETTNTWTTETPLPTPVRSEAATVDSLGRIVVAGGFDVSGFATNSVYVSQQLNQPDAAPIITTTSLGYAYANLSYSHGIFSTGNPQPTYALTAAPAGMAIDSNTGLISWAPTPSQVGSATVTVQASNYAGSTTQTYTLHVIPAAPTGLTATAASTSSIALSWNPVYDPAGVTYTVTEQKWVSSGGGKGSHGGYYVYTTVASGVTTAAVTIGGLATGSYHSYYVTAVDLATGISTARSVIASAQTWYLPTLSPFVLLGGAVMSDPRATVGQPISVSMISTGNPAPNYTLLSAPSNLSIDPNTGVVTYTPDGSSLGIVNYTVQASNAVGSVSQTYGFDVLPAPTIIFNDGPFTFNGYAFYATATAVGSDGVTPVSGSFTFYYSGPSNPPSFAGTYTVTAYFASADSNYGSTTATSTMIINPAQAVFGGLLSPTIPVGQPSVTLSGTLLDGTTGPASGTVNITLNGVTQAVALVTGDQFSATFDTSTLGAGAYTVTYAYVPGDPDFAAQNGSSTVTVTSSAPAPTIIFNDGPFTFNGSAFSATATAVGSDGVSPVNGAFTFTYSGPSNPPMLAGSYTVLASFTSYDPNYNSTTATSTMIINPAQAVFSSLSSPTIPVGTASVTLSGKLIDGTLYPTSGTVNVTLNGVTHAAALGIGGHFSSVFSTSSLAAGPYTVTYAYVPGDTNFVAKNGTSTLYVGAKPKVTLNPTSQTVAAGTVVTFTAAATGTPTPTVQWQVSTNGGSTWTNIAGAMSTTLTFTTSASQNGYRYRAVFTSSLGFVNTTVATLTVQTPPSVTINPKSQTVAAGRSVTFTAAASGNPKPTVQWQVSTDGGLTWTNITGATTTTLTFVTTLAENGYEYRALFTNILGTAITNAAILTV
jgi:hypothetical protein